MSDLVRKATSELIGTFVRVFSGVGSAVFGATVIGGIGVALAFGFTLLALAYAIGPIFAGLVVGSVLTVVHLVGNPLDGTSVNPARSLGPALFEGGEAMTQVWLFVAPPLLGAAIAALLAPIFDVPTEEQAARAPGADPDGAQVPA